MKKIFSVSLLLAFTVASVSCAPATKEIKSLETEKDKISYSIGVDLGNKFKKMSLDIDTEVVAKGIKDSMAGGQMLLTPDEFMKVMSELQKSSTNKSAEENLKEAKEFFAKIKKEKDITFTSSGLGYKVLREGKGAKPTEKDKVTVHYKGTLLDGKQFDSSYDRKEPVTFEMDKVIKGFKEGLQLMKEGEETIFYIPPELGYGERGAGAAIGPNEGLIFKIELLKIEKK